MEVPIIIFHTFSHVQVGNVVTSFENELVVITIEELELIRGEAKLAIIFYNLPLLISIIMTFLVWECYGSPEKHENSLKFVKICTEECFDKVLNEEF